MNLKRHSAVWLATAVVGVGATGTPSFAIDVPRTGPLFRADSRLGEFAFAHDYVLGTSMDLVVRAPRPEDALACEKAVLAEIERLRAILSTYDSSSEISRVMRGGSIRSGSIQSSELELLLHAYANWSKASGGAISLNMRDVIALWKQAARTNVLPQRSALMDAMQTPLAWNVDALGKGFIIDRAVEVARSIAPAGVLNIGGDIRAWGDANWKIGVTDPTNPAENADLLTTFDLSNSAVATSGGYLRFFTINGKRYSHVIDPRTGWPVENVTSATVVAKDCLTANALSTAATVLGKQQGQALLETFGARGELIVDDTNGVAAGGTISPPPAAPAVVVADASATTWPKDFQVSVEVALKGAEGGGPGGRGPGGRGRGGGGKRPYVAVWVENADQKVVRTISVWGTEPRYVPELSYWWKVARPPTSVRSITRATRPPGKYTVTWDGLDDHGQAVPAGKYTITVEINREHGRHVKETATIECKDAPQTATLKATAESDESSIAFGPRSQ